MPVGLVMLLNFTVNYLLLMGAARFSDREPVMSVSLAAAGLGAAYGGMCLLPGMSYLGGFHWHILSVIAMGVLSFGALRPCGVLVVLHLALDGLGTGNTLLGGLLLFLLCMIRGMGRTVPVELQYGAQKIKLQALRDTGNCLKDPVTGGAVMVIGPEIAKQLTGLSEGQLKMPLKTIGAIPGLRLIPYKAVGSSGFLLAMKLAKVRIGSWRGSYVVAFAPEGLHKGSGYEALIGGNV